MGQAHPLKVRNCIRGIPQVRLDKCFLPSFISLGRFLDLVPVYILLERSPEYHEHF